MSEGAVVLCERHGDRWVPRWGLGGPVFFGRRQFYDWLWEWQPQAWVRRWPAPTWAPVYSWVYWN